jgi:MFS family permease
MLDIMLQTKDNRLLVWAIIASQFAPPFMVSGVAVALPAMGIDLNAGATSLSLVETMYLASMLAFMLPVGRFAAASDKQSLYKLGLLGFAATSILIGMSSSIPMVLSLRLVQGIASAIIQVTGTAILVDLVPAKERGKAFGLSIGVVYAGLTLGPVCAGFLTDIWDWRMVFWVGGATLLTMCLLIHPMMPASWRWPPAKAVHIPSSILVMAAVSCLVAGSSLFREGAVGYAFLATGAVLAAAFVILQRRIDQPLVNVGLLMRNRDLATALFVQLLLYTNAFCVTFTLSIYMQVTLGYSAKASGQILAAGMVVMAFMAPAAGWLSDRYQPRVISAFGVAGVLVSTLMGMMFDERTGLAFILAMWICHGMFWAFFSSPNMTIIMNSVPASASSIASALGASARALGMLSGMLIAALLLSLNLGHEPVAQHPIEFVGIMETTFAVLTVLTAVVLVVCVVTAGRRQPADG